MTELEQNRATLAQLRDYYNESSFSSVNGLPRKEDALSAIQGALSDLDTKIYDYKKEVIRDILQYAYQKNWTQVILNAGFSPEDTQDMKDYLFGLCRDELRYYMYGRSTKLFKADPEDMKNKLLNNIPLVIESIKYLFETQDPGSYQPAITYVGKKFLDEDWSVLDYVIRDYLTCTEFEKCLEPVIDREIEKCTRDDR